MMQILYKNERKKREFVYQNGLTKSDFERISLLIECQLLLMRVNLKDFSVRDIIYSVYKMLNREIEKSREKNKEL